MRRCPGFDDRGLLAELLDRTRAILRADTAAVLLLDFSSGELIATAAAGLEEEVRQGVRIPVGWGFAGRIAATHQPVIVDHVDQLIPSIRPWKRTYCSAATYLFSDCPGRRRLG